MASPMWVEQINVENPYTKKKYDFLLEPESPHLILTGKNGSGKTTCLNEIIKIIYNKISQKIKMTDFVQIDNANGIIDQDKRKISLIHVLKFGSQRSMQFSPVSGPTQQLTPERGSQLHQILVNLRTQQAYAQEEQNTEEVQKIKNKINRIESKFKILFEDDQVELLFRREKIKYEIKINQQEMSFDSLPDGFNSLLHIWSELWAMEEQLKQKSENYFIIAFVDEVETHLHVSLQKRVLYFLTQFFPKVQFFVTTHSPLVLSSVDNAVIYDLGENKRYLSKDLMGLNYGNLMMSHLGLASDFDLQTTAELAELKALHRNPSRTEEQTARMRALAQKLAEKSHLLALHIWEELSEVP